MGTRGSRKLRRLVLVGLGLPLALIAIGAAAAYRRVSGACARIYDVDHAPSAPVAIVFGAGLAPGGAPMLVLEDRLRTAAELYRAGKVRKILVTGDHGRRAYDETAAMAEFLERDGIAPEDIFLDHAGFNTYDSLYRARDVFGVREAILVTQDFHLPRALYLAGRLGIESAGARADRHRYSARHRFRLREVAARVKAVIWAEILRPLPRYLGPTIAIEGDGRVTRDRKVAGR